MVFGLFKKTCPVCGMDVSKGGIVRKGKTFCSKGCYRKYRLVNQRENVIDKREKMGFIEKVRRNHTLVMVLCCVIPIILLLGAVYFFGLSDTYLFLTILLLCPLLHVFMMKDMHKKHSEERVDQND